MTQHLLPTTVVGSYPQPDWLIDRAMLATMVPRVRLHELWRVAEPYLAQAQDDATLLAIRDMERAGIDIITDGEMRRESYSNRFATALEGIDNETPATITNRAGRSVKVPRVVGKIRRRHAVEVGDMAFLRRNTERKAKITLPGPFTMAQQAKNEFYADDDETSVGLAYVEGIPDGREFFERIRSVAERMPLVLVKGGASEGGASDSARHTWTRAAARSFFDTSQ